MPEIRKNAAKRGIEVSFEAKPDTEVIRFMKERKYKWSPKLKIWYKRFGAERTFKADADRFVQQLQEFFDQHKQKNIDQLSIGIEIEKEHTSDPKVAKKIALDHLKENPNYYSEPKPANWAEKELKEEAEIKEIESAQAFQEVEQEILDENKIGTVRPEFMSKNILLGREEAQNAWLKTVLKPDPIGTFAGQVEPELMRKKFKENVPIKEVFEKAGVEYPDSEIDVYNYQDEHAERLIGSDKWHGGVWRYKFENAGDILRELAKYKNKFLDPGYIYEKVNKIEKFIPQYIGENVHSDDQYKTVKVKDAEILAELRQAYIDQPTMSEAQDQAKLLVLNLIDGKLEEAQKQIDYFNQFRGKTNDDGEHLLMVANTYRTKPEKEIDIRKEFLREQDGLKIYLVDGEEVRKSHIEFVSGGHGYVYDYIPLDEVWIDDNQKDKPDDMEATITHELFEIGKMRDEGMSYDQAHELANAVEKKERNNELMEPEPKIESEEEEISESREMFGYVFDFNPPNEEGSQLIASLNKINLSPHTDPDDSRNELRLTYKDNEYLIFDNSGEFKIDNKTTHKYISQIDFKSESGFIKNIPLLAHEIKEVILKDESESVLKPIIEKTPEIIPELEMIIEPTTSLSPSDYLNSFDLNKGIEKLLESKWNDKPESWSEDELEFIKGYTGYGGLDEYGQIDKGSLFEFYTPEAVIEKMWGLAYKHGYNEGRLCEPSVGSGLFLKREYVKSSVIKDAYEINKYSAKICKLLYPEVSVNAGKESMYFEQVFIKNNYTVRDKYIPMYDLVIGNPPYGEAQSMYLGMGEKSYTHAKNYIDYFIFRGLDLLMKDGLLIYIIGAEVAAGGTPWLDQGNSKTKEMIAKKGKLIDAYRLPEGLFARTNVVTDIVVFKKQ